MLRRSARNPQRPQSLHRLPAENEIERVTDRARQHQHRSQHDMPALKRDVVPEHNEHAQIADDQCGPLLRLDVTLKTIALTASTIVGLRYRMSRSRFALMYCRPAKSR